MIELLWPRGGWGRASRYIQLRVRRLPDDPQRISRGIFAGVFVTFTPFYGLHFIAAFFLAKVMRGNVFAALLATFVGNPVTFPFIAAISLQLGYWMLGIERTEAVGRAFFGKFGGAMRDLWHNFKAIFTDQTAHWERLNVFGTEIFFPYFVGGLVPGAICAVLAYYASEPVIRAYQNRRKGRLTAKLKELASKKTKANKPSGPAS